MKGYLFEYASIDTWGDLGDCRTGMIQTLNHILVPARTRQSADRAIHKAAQEPNAHPGLCLLSDLLHPPAGFKGPQGEALWSVKELELKVGSVHRI